MHPLLGPLTTPSAKSQCTAGNALGYGLLHCRVLVVEWRVYAAVE